MSKLHIQPYCTDSDIGFLQIVTYPYWKQHTHLKYSKSIQVNMSDYTFQHQEKHKSCFILWWTGYRPAPAVNERTLRAEPRWLFYTHLNKQRDVTVCKLDVAVCDFELFINLRQQELLSYHFMLLYCVKGYTVSSV